MVGCFLVDHDGKRPYSRRCRNARHRVEVGSKEELARILDETVAKRGRAGKEQVICGVCGFVMDEADECPRCKLMGEETAKDIKMRQEMRKALYREVDEILEEGWKDS